MSNIKFSGIMPALVTPLDSNGNIIKNAVKKIMDFNYQAGVKGFYVCGGTGEGVLLSPAQRKSMAETAIEANAGRGKIIIHTGSINSVEVLDLTRHATACKADGISSVPPSFYFKYSLDETADFYQAMADCTDLPILVYANVQTNAGIDVNAMIQRVLSIKNICGVKDTRSNFYALWQLKQLNDGNINVINGPDEALLSGLAAGADGGIGSTYTVMPEMYVKLYEQFKSGNISEAMSLQSKINRIIKVLLHYADGNIIRSIKESLRLQGIDAGRAAFPAKPFISAETIPFKTDMMSAGFIWQ